MKLYFYLLFIYLFIAEIFLSVSYTWKNIAKMAKYHFLLKYMGDFAAGLDDYISQGICPESTQCLKVKLSVKSDIPNL